MKERLPVGFMFKQINNIYEREFNNLLRGIGITSSQCAVLDYLLGSSKGICESRRTLRKH